MIIEIKVANYRSINEEQTLSFVADRATRHPDNLIKRPGYRLLKAVGLFGANASGKSNFLKAIGAMSAFVRDSATKMNDGDPIAAAEPYRLDPAAREQPSRFEITFLTDGTVYTYGFTADQRRVHEEWLSGKRENDDKTILYIKRQNDGNSVRGGWESLRLAGGIVELLKERTRDNALFLSTAARENVKELLPVYHVFRDRVKVHDMSIGTDFLFSDAKEICANDEHVLQKVCSLLRDADTGIVTLEVKSVTFADVLARNPEILTSQPNPSVAARHFARMDWGTRASTYRLDKDRNIVTFDAMQDESEGTLRFVAVVVPMLDALNNGVFVAIDEIDASLHPLLTRRLLEMFQSPEANPNGAQLLFTTHDPSLLDQVLFRRDQIWLAEKHDGASTFFSLADIKPPIRNTEAFLGNYLTGRYGGTPHLGPAFDMVETSSKA